jgi:hypothetical protein
VETSLHCSRCGFAGQDDAQDAKWFDVNDLPQPLAFDHNLLVRSALKRLSETSDLQAEMPGLAQQLVDAANKLV